MRNGDLDLWLRVESEKSSQYCDNEGARSNEEVGEIIRQSWRDGGKEDERLVWSLICSMGSGSVKSKRYVSGTGWVVGCG